MIDLPPVDLWLPPKPAIIIPKSEVIKSPAVNNTVFPFPTFMPAAGLTTYRYFKLEVTDNNGNTSFHLLTELEIVDQSDVDWPTSAMTSNSAPSPFVATESAFDANPAWKAFNKVTSGADQYWNSGSTGTHYITLDVGSGNDFAPKSFKMSNNSLGINDAMPKDFNLYGSNTGAFSGEEDTLKAVTGETSWTSEEERTYTI